MFVVVFVLQEGVFLICKAAMSLRFDIFHQTSKTWWLGYNHLNFVFCFSVACCVHDRAHLIVS